MPDSGLTRRPGKTKIAILGGGPSGMACAFGLTSSADWSDRYEVTVYQMGWRLGGKCASSRETSAPFRNYEHGLHVLGGFYHNSLRMLRDCYDLWQQFPNSLQFDDTFRPHNLVHVMDKRDGQWVRIRCPFPDNDKPLGQGETPLTPYSALSALLDWIVQWGKAQLGSLSEAAEGYRDLETFLHEAISIYDFLPSHSYYHLSDDHIETVKSKLDLLHTASARKSDGAREKEFEFDMMARVGLVFMRGIIADGLWRHGFDHINHLDFADWMRMHGGSEDVVQSVYCRAGYDYAFAYLDGDGDPAQNKARFAAGAGLRGMLRMILTYHRSVFVHMDGGMGEVVFTPLYQVLQARGVKFNFFHRIDQLRIAEDGRTISSIEGTVQAQVKGGRDNYQPLAGYPDGSANSRLFWPVAPDYSQFDGEFERPDAHAEDVYENPWINDGQGYVPFSLEHRRDFDIAVLAISVGALSTTCAELEQKNAAWREMMRSQHTIQTIAAQYWMNSPTAQLGWQDGDTVLTAFAQPYATWADMSFLLPHERGTAQQLSYLCGTLTRIDAPRDRMYPQKERERIRNVLKEWTANNIEVLWPNAVDAPGGVLRPGELQQSYARANCFPSDGYVLTLPDAVSKRLRTDESGYANLFLAGDWVRNGADTGSFENAVMCGLQASRAISGAPHHIYGETDFP